MTTNASRPQSPLIAVIGATGTGKSELAVALAKRYNGEVINGDAMQLYEGLPIITNKISSEEQDGVPHHLLGRIGLKETTWVVGTFVERALAVIKDVHSRGKVPILVGGTHYYTQSLIFREKLLDANGGRSGQAEEGKEGEAHSIHGEEIDYSHKSTEALLQELMAVDPIMANRWHPKDRRKIQRSLDIFLRTGQKASDVYAAQRAAKISSHDEEADGLNEGLSRFPTLIFWVNTERESLTQRLDDRVEKMMERGLVDEVKTLLANAQGLAEQGEDPDETRGIWVSIGYKEFKQYCVALQEEPGNASKLAALRVDAIERTKIATRQYAKSQVRWIRIKLANALADAEMGEQMFILDSTNVSRFEQAVVVTAADITNLFLEGCPLPKPSSINEQARELLEPKRAFDLSARPDRWIKEYCGVCEVTCVTAESWETHIRSKAHRKRAAKAKNVHRPFIVASSSSSPVVAPEQDTDNGGAT